jgi:hypothetical protein
VRGSSELVASGRRPAHHRSARRRPAWLLFFLLLPDLHSPRPCHVAGPSAAVLAKLSPCAASLPSVRICPEPPRCSRSLPRTPEPRAFLARIMSCSHRPSSTRTLPHAAARCHTTAAAPPAPAPRACTTSRSRVHASCTTTSRACPRCCLIRVPAPLLLPRSLACAPPLQAPALPAVPPCASACSCPRASARALPFQRCAARLPQHHAHAPLWRCVPAPAPPASRAHAPAPARAQAEPPRTEPRPRRALRTLVRALRSATALWQNRSNYSGSSALLIAVQLQSA